MTIFKIFLVLVVILKFSNNLNLKGHGVGDSFYASSIAVFRNRAFLTLPRSSCYNNLTQPTLIEVHWQADYKHLIAGRKLYFPSEKYQQWGKCGQLQDAIFVDVEVKKSRLWVLDKGTRKCPPKIVIYNLHTNTEIYSKTFDSPILNDFSSMAIDLFGEFGIMVYIGHSKRNILTIFSFISKKSWTIRIMDQNNSDSLISTERVTLSKTEPILYLTRDNGAAMFYVDLKYIRELTKSTTITEVPDTNAVFIGDKLGPSGGMISDLAGGLNYYLTRDFAVLRWKSDKPLRAENHDVLKQSYEVLPYVSHLFSGPQNGVWALINPVGPQQCINATERKNFKLPKQMPNLEKRVIKLFKHKKKGRVGNVLVFQKQ